MAETYIDEIVEYPAKVIQKIGGSKHCIGLLTNKPFEGLNQDDYDKALDEFIYDYPYVDSTTQTAASYIWVEVDVPSVSNRQIKNLKIYVTVACHKEFMKIDDEIFPGVMGNRRDNLARYIDRLLNFSTIYGIGRLSLNSIRSSLPSAKFVFKELEYDVPDFNLRELDG